MKIPLITGRNVKSASKPTKPALTVPSRKKATTSGTDLISASSKHRTETGKNLNRSLTKVAKVTPVLLLDEADALFSKRSSVRDSHDRYANIEVSYLSSPVPPKPQSGKKALVKKKHLKQPRKNDRRNGRDRPPCSVPG